MGIPTLEVGYTSATTGRGDHEVHKGHVVRKKRRKKILRTAIVFIGFFRSQSGERMAGHQFPPSQFLVLTCYVHSNSEAQFFSPPVGHFTRLECEAE
jgi:hypothetical protein